MMKVDIEIHKMPEGCPAFESGDRYGYSVTGNSFGCSSPVKSREEIVCGIRQYIKSEEKYYGEKIRLGNFSNSSGLDISSADIKGEEKLTQWF